jgi:hypothetical protein
MRSLLRCTFVALVFFATTGNLRAAAPPAGLDLLEVRRMLRKLDADSFHTRQKADDALRAMGKGVVPLLTAERERTSSLEVRSRLSRMIHDLTIDERIPSLVQMLDHANPQFGAQAEFALRQAGASVVPLLQKELRDLQGHTEPNVATRRKRLEKIIAELSMPRR